jgi:aldehyde:ferredoxin oxidoreductase
LEAIAKANELCNAYGIDTISTGSAIAFAMECYEKGLINKKDTGGIELTWGNHQAIIEIIHKVGNKEGFGKILCEGVKRAAESIGHGAQEFAVHVKGLEVPMHDPRAFKGMGLQYATSHRGACHLRGLVYEIEQGARIPDLGIHERIERFPTEGKARIVITMQDWHDAIDSLILCKFTFLPPASTAAILSMVTGWTVRHQELLEAGERNYNVKRLFNIRCGITTKDDTLPKRFLEQPPQDGGSKGEVVRLGEMLPEYYELRGWDKNGIPTKEKLNSLGLGDMAQDLERMTSG